MAHDPVAFLKPAVRAASGFQAMGGEPFIVLPEPDCQDKDNLAATKSRGQERAAETAWPHDCEACVSASLGLAAPPGDQERVALTPQPTRSGLARAFKPMSLAKLLPPQGSTSCQPLDWRTG